MAIWKVNYSEKYRRAALYNSSCNFNCRGCWYIEKGVAPEEALDIEQVKQCLRELEPECVHFLGGEPSINPQLPELLRFCKEELSVSERRGHIDPDSWRPPAPEERRVITRLGHSNGTNIPFDNLDCADVSFKAYDDEIHINYTGKPAAPIRERFRSAYQAGIELRANTVFVPDCVEYDQIEKIAAFIAGIDPQIRFHIIGYVPVRGVQWRGARPDEVAEAENIAKQYLTNVTSAHLTLNAAHSLRENDPRYASVRVL